MCDNSFNTANVMFIIKNDCGSCLCRCLLTFPGADVCHHGRLVLQQFCRGSYWLGWSVSTPSLLCASSSVCLMSRETVAPSKAQSSKPSWRDSWAATLTSQTCQLLGRTGKFQDTVGRSLLCSWALLGLCTQFPRQLSPVLKNAISQSSRC